MALVRTALTGVLADLAGAEENSARDGRQRFVLQGRGLASREAKEYILRSVKASPSCQPDLLHANWHDIRGLRGIVE